MYNPNRNGSRFNRNLLSAALVACLAMSAPALAQSTGATLRGQSVKTVMPVLLSTGSKTQTISTGATPTG